MSALVECALLNWGLGGASYALVAARENAVYRVETATHTFALRLHRKGYRTDSELWSELKWMQAVGAGGITVPIPIPSLTGNMLHTMDGVQIDLLSWLHSTPVAQTVGTLSPQQRESLFYKMGQQMAKLHQISDTWSQPAGFTRCAWDANGLVGEKPLWDRFWENPRLSRVQRSILENLRIAARAQLDRLEPTLDYGLIHADMVTENVMYDGTTLGLIDFDDGGFGYRLFEVATALLKFDQAPGHTLLRSALLAGYRSVRAIDTQALDLFMAVRAASYVGWNMTRLAEAGGKARNARFIERAIRLAEQYLA